MPLLGMNSQTIFLAVLASIAITLVTGWLAIRIARRAGLIDMPGTSARKTHRRPTPRAGGIAIALALVPLVFLFGTVWERQIAVMLAAAAIIFFFGIWDDKADLSARTKVIGQLLACAVILLAGMEVHIFKPGFLGLTQPALLAWMNRLITIVWIVGVTNAFNLADSMDGLVTGLSGWAFAFFIMAALVAGQQTLAIQSAIMAGICVSLYFYNSPEARLFLGDSGALTLGFILAIMAIIYTPLNRPQSSSWFVPIMLVGVPIFDTTLVFFSRLRRKVPFYQGNLDHTYHRLVAMGIAPNQSVQIMHLAALMLNCMAFIALSLEPLYSNLIFASCLVVGAGGIIFLESRFKAT
ncbi:MAG: undecaprenyl/decaprenyl-phosphate alpha-N-acetylglucosaminyl 1-phosphate transferase [Anaerolineae bacterium]|nr:undecaprenyl/decaprenyl-phosphate alpha-N-acetylglucosaminyl 1-phosphate transferase [Anaerolineae bacterium]